jgi:hypothetical protein
LTRQRPRKIRRVFINTLLAIMAISPFFYLAGSIGEKNLRDYQP